MGHFFNGKDTVFILKQDVYFEKYATRDIFFKSTRSLQRREQFFSVLFAHIFQ